MIWAPNPVGAPKRGQVILIDIYGLAQSWHIRISLLGPTSGGNRVKGRSIASV